MKVCWFSTGISSFVACYLSKGIDKIIYTHVSDQHPDSLRFLHDCERLLGREIEIIQSDSYKSVEDVILRERYINGPTGAKCSKVLKKEVRQRWEALNPGSHIYVWGYDVTEKHRADRTMEILPYHNHEFPLIEKGITKQDCHGIAKELGLKRPIMYDMGYSNNNCIGCVKGGKGYWNKIRKDFPEVFESRAKLERMLGRRIMTRCSLDELKPNEGRMEDEIMEDCGILCQLQMNGDD